MSLAPKCAAVAFAVALATAAGSTPLARQQAQAGQPSVETKIVTTPASGDHSGSTEAFRTIQERRRDVIHPGDPLDISGVFEGGNRLTAPLGGLNRSTFRPVKVDETEAHLRQLAMLGPRKQFTSGLSVLRPEPTAELMEKQNLAPVAAEEKKSDGSDAWIAALVASIAAMAALFVQSRR